jgi:hypothetical protein
VCYKIFDTAVDLISHQEDNSCLRESPDKQEGLNDGQIEEIRRILKKPKSPTENTLSDEEKWYEIWKIRFPKEHYPDLDPPSDPCENTTDSTLRIKANFSREPQPGRNCPSLFIGHQCSS